MDESITPRIDRLTLSTLSRDIKDLPSSYYPPTTSFPIACLESSMTPERYHYAQKIQDSIQRFDSEFRIRVEHLATILLVPFESFKIEGHLSHETQLPQVLQRRLESISPFCKHYMLHLDPENLNTENLESSKKKDKWIHALPQPVQDNIELESDMSYDEFLLAIHSRSSFATATAHPIFPTKKGDQEQNKCKSRDKNTCVLTGRPNPSVFWFIPKGWNDNATHNDATGNLIAGCTNLTNIRLLDELLSATELGKTHRVWNMICVDKVIRDLLMVGLCAFKFINTVQDNEDTFMVRLKFFWMPGLPGRFNQAIDLDKGINATGFNYRKVALYPELKDFSYNPRFPTKHCEEQLSAVPFSSISFGHPISIKMSEQESKLFESVVKIHWACVTFTALCGGAGQAWYLTGMNQANGSLEPRDKEFEKDEKKKKKEKWGFFGRKK